jgi:hypothetical protein
LTPARQQPVLYWQAVQKPPTSATKLPALKYVVGGAFSSTLARRGP